MTSSKLVEVFELYRRELNERGIEPGRLEDYDCPHDRTAQLVAFAHLAWMCGEAIALTQAGRTEKAFRWLGFIQGVLWAEGIYTLDDLKNHSRPA